MTTEEAKAEFMEACSEWADLLISDSERQVRQGLERWQFTDDEMIPRVTSSESFGYELPPSQKAVWAAALKLMRESYDSLKAARGGDG